MIAVPACDKVGSTPGSGHIVGSGTAGPVNRVAVLVSVGNMVVGSGTAGPVGAGSLVGVGNMTGFGDRGLGDNSTAGPVGGATLLAGIGNMRGSGNRGAGDLGDGATAGDR